jgi:isocitrate lyase
MSDAAIQALNTELGKLGYIWQFITLAYEHMTRMRLQLQLPLARILLHSHLPALWLTL